MKKGKNIIKFLLTIKILFCFSFNCFAGGPVTPFVHTVNGVKVLNFSAVNSCQLAYKETQISYFPKQMKKVDSSSQVFQEVVNFNFKALLNQSHMKGFKKQAQQLSEGVSSTYKTESGHKLAFKIDAIRTQSVVTYKGIVNAQLNYKLTDRALNIELSKKVANETQLVFTHADHTDERKDLLALRFNF